MYYSRCGVTKFIHLTYMLHPPVITTHQLIELRGGPIVLRVYTTTKRLRVAHIVFIHFCLYIYTNCTGGGREYY